MLLRKVGIGAAAVLAAGLLGAGCSEDGDTIIIGGSGDINLSDFFPATSISQNNLATDGAGLSPNNASVQSWKVVFATDHPASDGTFAGDNSAIIIFRILAGVDQLWYACHYEAGNLSPPVLLMPDDYDPTDNSSISADSVVCLFLGTSGFAPTDSSGLALGTAEQLGAVRAQHGNWVILLPGYAGLYEDPRLQLSQQYPTGDQPTGKHRTFWSFVFKKAWKSLPSVVVDNNQYSIDAGTTKSTKYLGEVFHYGFQVEGFEIPTARNGICKPHSRFGVTTPNASDWNTPAADVQSFGLVSDGFSGQSSFFGDGDPLNEGAGVAVPQNGYDSDIEADYTCGEAVSAVHLFYTQIVTSLNDGPSVRGRNYVSSVSPGIKPVGSRLAAYEASFDLKALEFGTPTLFQPVDSRVGELSSVFAGKNPGTGFYPTFHTYNKMCFFRYADASVHNHEDYNVGGNGDDDQYAADLAQSNQFGFGHVPPTYATYDYSNGTDRENGDDLVDGVYVEKILGKFHLTDTNGDGVAEIAGKTDLSFQNDGTSTATVIKHDIIVIDPEDYNEADETPKREIMSFNEGGQSIFGSDEGLWEQVIFYTWADNTIIGGPDDDATNKVGNIYRMLCAASFTPTGDLVDEGTATWKNPKLVSKSQGNHNWTWGIDAKETRSGAPQLEYKFVLADPVTPAEVGDDDDMGYFSATMNRTGTFILVSYIQPLGDSGGTAHRDLAGGPNSLWYAGNDTPSADWYMGLQSVVYATTRYDPYATTTTPQTARTLDAFTAPVETGQTSGVSITGMTTGLYIHDSRFEMAGDYVERQKYVPVNKFSHQDEVGYRIGFQSDPNVIWLYWEQSDATNDRLFVRQLDVTPGFTFTPGTTATVPALSPLGIVEPETSTNDVSSNSVQTDGSNQQSPPGLASGPTYDETFPILNGGLGDVFVIDLGQTNAQLTAGTGQQGGGVIVCYQKCTDNTDGSIPAPSGSVVATAKDNGRNVKLVAGYIGGDSTTFSERTDALGRPSPNDHEKLAALMTHGSRGPAAGMAWAAVRTAKLSNVAGAFLPGETVSSGQGGSGIVTASTGITLSYLDAAGVGLSGTITGATSFATANVDEDNGLSLTDDAILAVRGAVIVPRNTDIVSGTLNNGGHQANAIYLYMRAPYGNKNHGLWTRKIDLAAFRAATATPFVSSFTPALTADPTRLDHGDTQDIGEVNTDVVSGTSALVIFQQDAHIWGQPTSDGVNYSYTGGMTGLPNPVLADDDSSENIIGWSVDTAMDAQANVVDGVLSFSKNDQDFNARLRLRTQVRP